VLNGEQIVGSAPLYFIKLDQGGLSTKVQRYLPEEFVNGLCIIRISWFRDQSSALHHDGVLGTILDHEHNR
jgi:hypothetical protein